MEHHHVHQVYEQIASKFNHTRFSHWKAVRLFLDNLPKYSLVADIGTGNGKYLGYREDITVIGNDMCDGLLNIIKNKDNEAQVLRANALHLPYKPSSFDAVISIAVFHHISSYEGRCRFIEEIIDVLKPKGKALITVWAREQSIKSTWKDLGSNDFFVPWTDVEKNQVHDRYYHLFSKDELLDITYNISCKKNVQVCSLEYERDNWCLTLERIL
jgi:tRNA (uracil-5-)-methyltransferase TRM9